MNIINDRDLTELSSYMVYQDINKDNNFTVNENDLSKQMNLKIYIERNYKTQIN